MLSTNGEIVWQPVCKRVDILSTHSKTVHLDSFLPLKALSIKIRRRLVSKCAVVCVFKFSSGSVETQLW